MGKAESHGGGFGGDLIMGRHAYSYTTEKGEKGYGATPKDARDNASRKGDKKD